MNLGVSPRRPRTDVVDIGRGVTRIGDGERIAILNVMPHDFGNGPQPGAQLALARPGAAEQIGWVGVGSQVAAGGRTWTVSAITPESKGGPSIRLEAARA